MKIKKILAAVAASAVAVSAMAVNAFAADEYTVKLGFSDMSWTYQDWESSTTVTGDGQYTLESTAVAGAPDFGVFVLDIEGMYSDHPEATAVLDKVEIDGAEVSFDASKIRYGDIENKGNYRIEIYNQYGDTKDDSGIAATPITSDLKLTFTVSGLGGGDAAADTSAADDTAAADTSAGDAAPAPDSTTDSATTGNVPAVAMISVMTVAGIAAAVSRKRK